MKIVEAKVGVIGGKLRRSVGNAHQRWAERHSVLLVLRDEAGNIGLGEAAPLPGYSPDTLDGCEQALRAIAASGNQSAWNTSTWFQGTEANPASRFAIETAVTDLLAQRNGVPSSAIHPGAEPRAGLQRCGLIDGEIETWEETWAALNARSVSTFKVKVGRKGQATEELRGLQSLRRRYGDGWTLRLDANGAWSPAEAEDRLGFFASLGIEFVEQPCRPGELLRVGDLPVPWAADESVRNPKELERLKEMPCAALVLKPSILGGFFRCALAPNRFGHRRMPAVVSHLFEGPVAMAANCEIALALPDPALAAGLDTHDALSAWPEMPIPQLQQPGVITAAKEPGLGFTREQREEIASWIE